MNNELHSNDSSREKFRTILLMIIIVIIVNTKPVDNFIRDQLMPSVNLKIMTRNMYVKRQGDISIYYHKGADESDINFIESSIENTKNQKDSILGATSTHPLSIILFSSRDEFPSKFKNAYKDAISFYGFNIICLSCDNMNQHVIIHEFNHYIFDCFCKDKKIDGQNVPVWFQEGLAEYSTYSLTKETFKAHPPKKVKSFKELNTPEDIAKAVTDGYDVYTQAYLAINKIISTNKADIIQNILVQCRSMDFYDALKKTTNESIEDIERSITNSK